MKIYYATHDGHTASIAQFLETKLCGLGVDAEAIDLARETPPVGELASPDSCVVLAAIRYGHPLEPATRLMKMLAPLTPMKPVIVLLVNLTARKPQKRSAETNNYLRKWLARTGVKPLLAEAIPGKLNYPIYRWFDRLMIQFIMTLTGGPTDPTLVVDFTDWERLDALASEIAAAAPRNFQLSDETVSAG